MFITSIQVKMEKQQTINEQIENTEKVQQQWIKFMRD